jgi:hypothetical protein
MEARAWKLRKRARETLSKAEAKPLHQLISGFLPHLASLLLLNTFFKLDTPTPWLIAHSVGSGSSVKYEQLTQIFSLVTFLFFPLWNDQAFSFLVRIYIRKGSLSLFSIRAM